MAQGPQTFYPLSSIMYASKIPKSAQLFGSSPQEACSWVVGSLGQPVSFAGRTVMTCSCFLPDCQLCCDRRLAVEQQARSARCHCYSLGCLDCNPDGGQAPTDDNQFMRALHSIGGTGLPGRGAFGLTRTVSKNAGGYLSILHSLYLRISFNIVQYLSISLSICPSV